MFYLPCFVKVKHVIESIDSVGADFSGPKLDCKIAYDLLDYQVLFIAKWVTLWIGYWADFSGPKLDCKIAYDLLDYQYWVVLPPNEATNMCVFSPDFGCNLLQSASVPAGMVLTKEKAGFKFTTRVQPLKVATPN
ncbi:hypothetical protein L1987_02706 [Smallanthus sonchifolius]|uniref:Uncharacterized protein n=1 Tax=Smallanthus sonchifolius TaxID=185202 RepID=A0ACB9K8J2_9ASTR|nr:hypothetical protein L1987_02706 [Smallanthus sonchifolius]